jgi:hypothetical protein
MLAGTIEKKTFFSYISLDMKEEIQNFITGINYLSQANVKAP